MIELGGAKVAADTKAKTTSFTLQPKNPKDKPIVLQTKDKQEQTDWIAQIEAEMGRSEAIFEISHVADVDASDVKCWTVIDGVVWGGTVEMRMKAWDMEKFNLTKNIGIDLEGLLPEGEAPPGSSMTINNICDYDNRIWLSASKFLVCLDKASLLPQRCSVSHTQPINQALGYEGRLWTCSDDSTIKVWDAFSYECIQTFSEMGGKQFAMIRAGNQVWAAGWDGCIRVFNGKTLQLQRALELKHQDSISSFTSSYGSIWAGSWDGSISIWS